MVEIDRKKNWNLAMREGVFSAIVMGITQDYFAPFILFLGATATQVGLLTALPNLFSAMIQVKAAELVNIFRSRKYAVQVTMILQALILLTLVFFAFFGLANIWIMSFLIIIFVCVGALLAGVYSSMLVDFVDNPHKGELLGKRNRLVGLLMILSSLSAGLFLFYGKYFNQLYVFATLFLFAGIFRLFALRIFSRMTEKSIVVDAQNNFTLGQFFSRLRESNFAKFVLFVSAMQFAANLASPFFAVHMLKDLGFNYITYTIVTISATATIYFMMQRWGKHADIVGNLRVIRFVAPFIGVVPLLWILDRSVWYLIFAQVFSGFVWSGFTLCTVNFIYDAVSEGKRVRCISYFNFCSGIAVCLGVLTGGFILNYLPPIFGYKFLTLCLISGVLRIIVGLIMPFFVKEVRPVKNIRSHQLFFSVMGLRPIYEKFF
jgi:MFS family permease